MQVLLEEAETAQGIAELKAGRLDLLIVYEYNLLPDITDAGIELTLLVTESLLAAVHLPRGRLRLDVLRDQPWIAPRSDTALRARRAAAELRVPTA